MAVCGLEECDFVEAEIDMSSNIDNYLMSVPGDARVDHGMIVEYFNELHERLFDYSPPNMTPTECFEWAKDVKKQRAETYGAHNVLLLQVWVLKIIMIQRVHFDHDLWDSLVPKIERFWKDVVTMRGGGASQFDTQPTKPKKSKKRMLDITEETNTNYNFIDSDDES